MLKDKLIGDGLTDDSVRLFANRERIIPVHVYNETGQIRTELSIDEVLQGMGFQKPIHIPVKSKPGAEVPEPTHLAYAVQTGTIYIFPQEFDFGICTTIKELKDKK